MIIQIKNIGVLTILVTLFLLHSSFAQKDNGLASWNTIGLQYKLNKKITFDLEQHLRHKEDFTFVDKYFTQFQTSYKFAKNFELIGGLRFIRENDTEGRLQGYENHFRFQVDLKYKYKIKNFDIGYRFRYQNKNYLDENDLARQNFRFKTNLTYKIKNWPLDPNFSTEIFNRHKKVEDTNSFSKYRLTFGTTFKLREIGNFKCYYRIEKELNVDTPETFKIIGLKYTYIIKNKKK